MKKTERTLVFTIALNGYQWLFSENLRHQKFYADKNGYDFVAITRPYLSLLGLECAWLKITLLQQALVCGYDRVIYVDADADIQPTTPHLDTIMEPDKYLYLAQGYSGRFNSGVIIVRNSPEIATGLAEIVDACEQPPPPEDSVGWGENGHVIHYAKNKSFVKTLTQQWNNNSDPHLDDYIRHYSMGPLRDLYRSQTLGRIFYLIAHYTLAIAKRLSTAAKQDTFKQRLMALTQKTIDHYPIFQRARSHSEV